MPPQGADEAGPALFLLVGLPGVGKTTFARQLALLTGAAVLESDRLRSLLFGAPVFSQRESGMLVSRRRLGRDRASRRAPSGDHRRDQPERGDRRPFYELADETGTPLSVIALDAPVEVVEAR